MSNPYIEYYENQAGSGIAGFAGQRYQRGHGFFGSLGGLFQNILKPLGLYLGKKAFSAGTKIGNDVLEGENFKDSIKKRMKSTKQVILNDAIERAKVFAQTGKGRKSKRRRRKKRKTSSKKRKTLKKKINKKRSKKTKPFKKKKSKRKDLSHLF